VSRAVANRFHSSPSALRSTPLIAFHSSRIAVNRSPDVFQLVDSAGERPRPRPPARSSRPARPYEPRSRAAREASAFSVRHRGPASRVGPPSPSMSPTTCASGSDALQPLDRGERVLRVGRHRCFIRASRRLTSVTRSAYRRAKVGKAPPRAWPACHDPDRAFANRRSIDEHGAVSIDAPECGPVFHQSNLVLPGRDAMTAPPANGTCDEVSPGIVTGAAPVRVERLPLTVTIWCPNRAGYRGLVPLVAASICPHPSAFWCHRWQSGAAI